MKTLKSRITESLSRRLNEGKLKDNVICTAFRDFYDGIVGVRTNNGDMKDVIDNFVADWDTLFGLDFDRDKADVDEIVDLLADHCFIFNPGGGYNDDTSAEDYLESIYGIKPNMLGLGEEDDIQDLFPEIEDVDSKVLRVLSRASKKNLKVARSFYVSGYDFPMVICFDVMNPMIKDILDHIDEDL